MVRKGRSPAHTHICTRTQPTETLAPCSIPHTIHACFIRANAPGLALHLLPAAEEAHEDVARKALVEELREEVEVRHLGGMEMDRWVVKRGGLGLGLGRAGWSC